MGKLSDWIKKNILNKKQTENTEKETDKIEENIKEEKIYKEKEKKEKIHISHMDDLFWEAGRFVIEKDKGSIGMLQRQFKIGFNRAARIMGELYEAGVVGEEMGATTRKVLMSYYDFEELWIDGRIVGCGKQGEYKEPDKTENLKKYIYPSLFLLRKYIEPVKAEGFSVAFREVLSSNDMTKSANLLSFAIGKGVDNRAVVSSVLEFPQIIIPDNTKSGKAVCLNSMIMSFVYRTNPNELRMILIDTSNEVFGIYNGIPHLLIPVVADIQKAFAVLKWVVLECDNRNKQFQDFGASNIREYNLQKEISYRFPPILIFINDFSDLLLVHGKQIEELVSNITQQANKTGIYPIIAETNFNCSVSIGKNIEHKKKFVVVPSMDLMRSGIEPTFVQGAYVSEEEILGVVSFL